MSTCRPTEAGYLLDGEHYDGCDDPACRGCFPCVPTTERGDPLTHCTAKARCTQHVPADTLSCPRCVGKTRDALADIETMDRKMLTEAVHRGVNSEAASLAGPAPDTTDDIRAYGYRQSSIAMGRVPGTPEATDKHPLNVLGWYDMAFREDYDHPSDDTITVARAVEYLDAQLDRIANDPDQDFPQFVKDVNACRTHLEAVLHDHGQGDRAGVGCFDCKDALERKLTKTGFEDHWTCRGCDRRYTYAEYNFALRAALEDKTKATEEKTA